MGLRRMCQLAPLELRVSPPNSGLSAAWGIWFHPAYRKSSNLPRTMHSVKKDNFYQLERMVSTEGLMPGKSG
jgi:hypothetical protein